MNVPKRLRISIAVLVLFISAVSSAEIPDIIPSERLGRSAPIWRSVAALTAESGGIRWDLFSADELNATRQYLERAPDEASGPCVFGGLVVFDDGPNIPSYEAALEYATGMHVYTGTVLGFKEGFLRGRAGSIYEIAIDEILNTQGETSTPERILMHYPVADFFLGGKFICNTGSRLRVRPQVGGRLILFSRLPVTSDGTLLEPRDSNLFFEGNDGYLSVPRELRDAELLRSVPLLNIEEALRNRIAGKPASAELK